MNEKYINAADCEKYFYEHLDDNGIRAALNAIEEMPAADVEPVKHGRWIHCPEEDKNAWRCSECTGGWLLPDGETPEANNMRFCHRCGAKMDLKDGEAK